MAGIGNSLQNMAGQARTGGEGVIAECRRQAAAARITRRIMLGSLPVGGGAPVLVQSMTNTDTRDTEATLAQIARLREAGCEAVRVAVPDEAAAAQLGVIVSAAGLPIIADIHFDWRLAVASAGAGAAGLRINPGNIGSAANVKRVTDAARANGAILRIGVNSGSLQKELLAEYGRPAPEAMARSALAYVRMMEDLGFYDFKLSLKSSSVLDTIAAYRLIASWCDYPLHIGVTEAGTRRAGTVKSAIGLGILLHEGIGDTIRVSLTGPPEEEVAVAWDILSALNLRRRGPEIISCPTCGRTEIDLLGLANAVEKALAGVTAPIKVAVMGCVVNGPGEAREADIGVAGGRDRGIIFRKGQVLRAVNGQEQLLNEFLTEIHKLIQEQNRITQ